MLVFLLFACSPEKLNHIEEPELQVWSYNGYEEETILFCDYYYCNSYKSIIYLERPHTKRFYRKKYYVAIKP